MAHSRKQTPKRWTRTFPGDAGAREGSGRDTDSTGRIRTWGKKTNSNALYGTCRVHGGGYNILYITKNGAESYEVYTTLDRGEPRVIHR